MTIHAIILQEFLTDKIDMKVEFNDIIPFKGYLAMCIWPFVFVRNSAKAMYDALADNHESVHAEQQREMLLVGVLLCLVAFVFIGPWALLFLPLFFWWYGLEYIFRLVQYRDAHKAYRNISFEREAYANQSDMGYIQSRRHFAWFNYIILRENEN